MTNKFWVVINESRGPANPFYRHTSETSAFTEAERLARQNKGKFFVMECKGAAQSIDVQVARFDNDDEIPF